MAKESICRSCFHSYVCEQFDENRDNNNEKCHFFNDHYVPTADVVSALRKQIPEKPIEDGYYDEPAVCPNCGGCVINMADNDYKFQHCHYCGQAIDWDEAEKGGAE